MTEWKRKHAFVGELRRFLRRFRIVEMKTEVLAEAECVEPYTEREPGEHPGQATLIGQCQFRPTGRFVVNISLTGYWRDK